MCLISSATSGQLKCGEAWPDSDIAPKRRSRYWGQVLACKGAGHGTMSPRSLVAVSAYRVITAQAGHPLALSASRCPAKAGGGGGG